MANRKQSRTTTPDRAAVLADAALDAVGDRTRRLILARLRDDGPLPVARLADALPVSRPAVSQHLKVLKEAGLVVDRVDGTRRIYELDPDGIQALQRYTDDLWTSALERFAAAAEGADDAVAARQAGR
jgi:DNA-binding transcriptional ArsR family regulator